MKTNLKNFPTRKHAIISGLNVSKKAYNDDEVSQWRLNFETELKEKLKDNTLWQEPFREVRENLIKEILGK